MTSRRAALRLVPPLLASALLAPPMLARAEGEKLIVFSDCKSVLEVLRDALRRARGDGAVGLILGETNFEARMETLRRFNESPACCALLLSVQACASGLTLTNVSLRLASGANTSGPLQSAGAVAVHGSGSTHLCGPVRTKYADQAGNHRAVFGLPQPFDGLFQD